MKKRIIKFLKRVVISFFFLYSVNYLLSFVDIFLPINLFTLFGVSFLGFPGLVSFIILFFVVK